MSFSLRKALLVYLRQVVRRDLGQTNKTETTTPIIARSSREHSHFHSIPSQKAHALEEEKQPCKKRHHHCSRTHASMKIHTPRSNNKVGFCVKHPTIVKLMLFSEQPPYKNKEPPTYACARDKTHPGPPPYLAASVCDLCRNSAIAALSSASRVLLLCNSSTILCRSS